MQIDIAPETERLVREEISSGHFRSVDELIKAGVEALREKNAPKSLVQFFRDSPLVGLELQFERDQDTGREIAF
jgi:Arc/MetJ-type ribon-helix-helix transcriptional regulator